MEAYARYGRALIRKAERILKDPEDARDVVHGLFVDLLQKNEADGTSGQRPAWSRPEMDLPYLYRAVTNRCLTFVRDETNRARLLARNDGALGMEPRTRCDDRAIDMDLLVKLVRRLDDETSQVLAYRFLDDMTQEEIAELLGLSRKTIGKRLEAIQDAVRSLAKEGAP
jgi:RNA polymerase sigma-70 factor (ECF subfamily)